ncbi:MAG: cation:proton antiporter [Pseudomonadota bacterium]
MNDHGGLFEQLLLLLGASVVLVVFLHRLRIPALLAFLAIGAVAGPGGLSLIGAGDTLHALAEFGVVFLLFTLGLEFSLPRLIALRSTVFGIGSLQVLLCGLLVYLVAHALGLPPAAAFVIAGGLALSSTAIVSRELVASGELHSRHGQLAIGILLFQDIVAVLMLIALPVLAGERLTLQSLVPLGSGVLLLGAMLAIGRWLLPRALEEAARTRSEELFMMAALLVALLAAWLTQQLGLSMALGAFLAGMVLGESRFRHQVESDIRPFRDLLLGLFFISIGLLLDVRLLLANWALILGLGLALVLAKFVLVAGMTRALGETRETALRTGLALAQGGEFFFALLALAGRESMVPADTVSILIAVTLVSMSLTPLLLRRSEAIAGWLLRRGATQNGGEEPATDLALHSACDPLSGHVLVLGYGRVGQTLARFLRAEQVPFVALDTDVVRVREAERTGDTVYFGDPVRRDVLRAAGIERAALLVVSFDHVPTALRIVAHARELRADVPILVRTRDDTGLADLQAAGATEVVPETLEASLMLVSHLFMLLGTPAVHVQGMLHNTRQERYRLLRPVQDDDTKA